MEQTLGKRIAEHRKRLGLTQDALAEKLGITAQAVSKWENDLSCPDIAMLPRLAEIFGISTDELLGMEHQAVVHEAEVVHEEETERDGVHVQNGNWEFHWDGGRKSGLTFAICVLWVGVLTLLSKIYDWDISFWGILWPSVLLFYGFFGLFPRFNVFHLGLALFGGYSLVANLNIWQISFAEELIFPICVVLFGSGLLLEALRKPKKPRFRIHHRHKTKSDCHVGEGRFQCDLSFGEATFPVECDCLNGGEANVSFGELTVDLSDCAKVTESCHIEANCSFGELCFLVPRRFAVQPHNSTAFAAVNISGHPDPEPAGTIQMDANASFGEISICYI